MIQYKTSSGTPVKIWVDSLKEVDEGSLAQLDQMGKLPFIHSHIAVMPDVHLGKGAVIGSVVPAKDAVVPNIVGVDIGCGISAIPTGITLDQIRERIRELGMEPKEFWRQWELEVRRDVPTGFDSHKRPTEWEGFNTTLRAPEVRPFMEKKAVYQLGTLGGGNHFIEAQLDENDQLWFMVHSGSRHTGLQIANHYNRQAEKLLDKAKVKYPPNLAYLPGDSELFEDYLHDMEWAVAFALENRWRMLEKAYENFLLLFDPKNLPDEKELRAQVRSKGINIHHNFARRENHYGEPVIVHRKGATSARPGEIGIIPGSMGSHSYIVRGLGNPESFRSCSHGAGRVMSRRKAAREIPQREYEAALAGTFTRARRSYVDEAPQVYKDIDDVIRKQSDLVEVLHVLRPIITIKGDSRAAED
ncbi:MAG: RNA-splicing ligase RtcB [Candidatus Poribacteria bacterium]|nr:MAG: RNA-splicing ligase RtcB [Candidatus Poribacteria bacterium]